MDKDSSSQAQDVSGMIADAEKAIGTLYDSREEWWEQITGADMLALNRLGGTIATLQRFISVRPWQAALSSASRNHQDIVRADQEREQELRAQRGY